MKNDERILSELSFIRSVLRKQSQTIEAMAGELSAMRATEDRLITTDEAARMIGISAWSLRMKLNRGEFPGTKTDSKWKIKLSDVTSYVARINTVPL